MTEDFTVYSIDFASRIQYGLYEAYKQGFNEPKMVQNIVNNLDGLSKSFHGFEISTIGIFIHGTSSQVKFKYNGSEVHSELGDLIFILSVIYNREKYFEKFTISQSKKDNNKLKWDLRNKKQIYLLSHFPSFKGVKGSMIPQETFILHNYYGCLGSFNLLFRPGDFIFISAPLLEMFIGNRNFIDIKDIKLWESWLQGYYFSYPIPFDWYDIEELFYVCRKYRIFRNRLPVMFYPLYFGILGFSHFASNIYDFVDKYLRGFIGELVYSYENVYNKPAFDFLQKLLSKIKEKVINFSDKFFMYPYKINRGNMRATILTNNGSGNADKHEKKDKNEGGGIGIIYTLINLGEGKA